jgi:hypothetical protein
VKKLESLSDVPTAEVNFILHGLLDDVPSAFKVDRKVPLGPMHINEANVVVRVD